MTAAENNVLTLGELIEKYRRNKDLTQKEFGELIGKTQATVSYYEKSITFPRADEIRELAKIMNVPIAEIYTAIDYAKKGIIQDHEPLLIDLSQMSPDELNRKYTFMYKEDELSPAVRKEVLEFIKFKHSQDKQ